MKNVLIPTTYESDTLEAMKIASRLLGRNDNYIVLLSASDVSDSIQELLFLSSADRIDQSKRTALMKEWIRYKEEHDPDSLWRVMEHHQFIITPPIVDALLERFGAALIIIPDSLRQSREHPHRYLLQLLNGSACPLMLLPPKTRSNDRILRTLLVGEYDDTLVPAIHEMSLDIVHHAVKDSNADFLRLLIDALGIELVVQPKNRSGTIKSDQTVSMLGVAVLSV